MKNCKTNSNHKHVKCDITEVMSLINLISILLYILYLCSIWQNDHNMTKINYMIY